MVGEISKIPVTRSIPMMRDELWEFWRKLVVKIRKICNNSPKLLFPRPAQIYDRLETFVERSWLNVGSSKNLGRATFRKMPEAGLKIAQKGLKNTFFVKILPRHPVWLGLGNVFRILGGLNPLEPHPHVWLWLFSKWWQVMDINGPWRSNNL